MINILSSTNIPAQQAHGEWLGNFINNIGGDLVTVSKNGDLFFVTNPDNEQTFLLVSATHGRMQRDGWNPKGSIMSVEEAAKSLTRTPRATAIKTILAAR